MEENELKALLQASESETLEFKPRLSAKNRQSKEKADLKAKKETEHRILKSIAGLLNCAGGTLVVGVDNHGVPNGKLLEGFQNTDEAEVHLTNLVVENLGPLAAAHTQVTFHNVDGHPVLVMECPFNVDVFPVYVSQRQSTSDRILYVRVNNSTREYSGEDQIKYIDFIRSRHTRLSRSGSGAAQRDSTAASSTLFPVSKESPKQQYMERKTSLRTVYLQASNSHRESKSGFVSPPPSSTGFRGRESELSRLKNNISNPDIVVTIIGGVSGVGKTYLASYFASTLSEYSYQSIWVDCREDTTAERVLLDMAASARKNNDAKLADTLENINVIPEERLIKCTTALNGYKYAIFFDDFHATNNLNELIRTIVERSNSTKIFLTTRTRSGVGALSHHPASVDVISIQDGLDLESCKKYLTDCRLSVDEETAERIWKLTGKGHPQAIKIFSARAIGGLPIDYLLQSLPAFSQQLKQEWLKPLMDEISTDSRKVIIDLSVFDRPIPFDAIEYLFPYQTDRILQELLDRFILDNVADSLSMHMLVREHCYTLIDRVSENHKWAADYYLGHTGTEEDHIEYLSKIRIDEYLAAWSHLVKAEDQDGAVSIIKKLRTPLIDQGQYEQLMFILENTSPTDQRDRHWFTINKARIHSLWNDPDHAVRLISPITKSKDRSLSREAVLVLALIYCEHDRAREAVQLLETNGSLFAFHGDARNRPRRRYLTRLTRAYRLVGEYEKSVAHAQNVLKMCDLDKDTIGGGKVLLEWVELLREQNNVETARSLCERGIELLSSHAQSRDLAAFHMMAGAICQNLGQRNEALRHTSIALDIFTTLTDRKNIVYCRNQMDELNETR